MWKPLDGREAHKSGNGRNLLDSGKEATIAACSQKQGLNVSHGGGLEDSRRLCLCCCWCWRLLIFCLLHFMGTALRGRIQTTLLLERDSGKCNAQASKPWDDRAQLLQGLGGVNADSP